jgi:MarR family transcriptional regulator for hemolysin
MLEYDFEESIGYWVCMTSHELERALNAELAQHGITYRQWQVLGWLALEGSLSQTELAERMRIEAPTLVGILDRMERDGWIQRQSCPDDRRKKLITATPRVEPIWSRITSAARRVRARATQGLNPKELQTLKELLGTVRENLRAGSLVEEAVP